MLTFAITKEVCTLRKNESMKLKRSTTIPLILLIYLIGMSIYAWPGRNQGLSYIQYGATILVTLACIVFLWILFKKRDKMRDKNKKR